MYRQQIPNWPDNEPWELHLRSFAQRSGKFLQYFCARTKYPEPWLNVWLQSNNIYSPVINPQYFSNSVDMELCRTGLKMALDLGNGLSAWRKKQITPFPSINLNEYIINSACSVSQPVGTCKMGVDDMGRR
ncbi:MAG: hypothetical protein COV66_12290 [Nitrospinae bacterium CG11_big_fil_rev_8_21_14_0_20_45_15]|nr:MAG: hypothetical protein COV66_12290 [Nitrospinae bacterium CG11_big_fil_rev_8_21_14_0_20_45_15]